MTWASLVFSFVKVLVVVLFLLNMAAITVWLDRRQSAMLQDRVGPNRAVVYLPSGIVRALLTLPAVLIAGALAVGLLGTAGYFFTYFHVFKQTVWTIMYMELVQQKDLDDLQ